MKKKDLRAGMEVAVSEGRRSYGYGSRVRWLLGTVQSTIPGWRKRDGSWSSEPDDGYFGPPIYYRVTARWRNGEMRDIARTLGQIEVPNDQWLAGMRRTEEAARAKAERREAFDAVGQTAVDAVKLELAKILGPRSLPAVSVGWTSDHQIEHGAEPSVVAELDGHEVPAEELLKLLRRASRGEGRKAARKKAAA